MIKIVENQYFPCLNYTSALITGKHFTLESNEGFQKTSFRNRCVLTGNNGLVSLNIPVRNGREQKAIITSVEVDNTQDWKRRHLRTIESCYKRAPFFEYYYLDVQRLILAETRFLFELNLSILKWVLKILKWEGSLTFTESYIKDYSNSKIIDFRSYWLPKNFQEKEQKHFYYQQVFEEKAGFQPNLSILDLLFCQGPNSKNILTGNI